MMDIFEKATKEKARFAYKGQLSVEDLWDLRLEDLDAIYRQYNGELKATSEDSLLQKPTTAGETLALKVEVVKRIVTVKLAEIEARKERAEKLAKKRRITEILAQKQDEVLSQKSEADLLKMLEEL